MIDVRYIFVYLEIELHSSFICVLKKQSFLKKIIRKSGSHGACCGEISINVARTAPERVNLKIMKRKLDEIGPSVVHKHLLARSRQHVLQCIVVNFTAKILFIAPIQSDLHFGALLLSH